MQQLPEPKSLVDQHAATLADTSFTSEERLEQSSSQSDQTRVQASSIRSGDAGTRVTSETDGPNAEPTRTKWYTGNVRIGPETHRYNPNGITPPFIQRQTVATLVDLAAFERVDVTGGDEPVYVFEASSVDESVVSEYDGEFQALNLRAEVAGAGYLKALSGEITLRPDPEADQTSTVTYEYAVSDVGSVSVSPPDFVENAIRVTGSLAEDRSTLVLEHTGGPAVAEGTDLIVEDAEYTAGPRQLVFPSAFESGDTAHVYWESAEKAAITLGEAPSEVGRKFALPPDDGDRGIYLQSRPSSGNRFAVAIYRQA